MAIDTNRQIVSLWRPLKMAPGAGDLHLSRHCVRGRPIEYRSDDVTKNPFFGFQCFGYHVSVQHDEKHSQPKVGGNRFMRARDMAA